MAEVSVKRAVIAHLQANPHAMALAIGYPEADVRGVAFEGLEVIVTTLDSAGDPLQQAHLIVEG